MALIRTSNNPKMLIWARQEIGYSVEQAAKAIGTTVKNLKLAESGEQSLTLNQLRKAADKYSCPYGYFYLSHPPHNDTYEPIPDYRIKIGLTDIDHFGLKLEIKKSRQKRRAFLDLAKSLEIPIKKFVTINNNYDKNSIGDQIRNRLKISHSEISSLQYKDIYSYWKDKIEADGVLVHESQYIPNDSGVIGSAMYYQSYPIILIKRNSEESERKLFTLLHEYAHLLKGMSAINDLESQYTSQSVTLESRIESECNYLAADILIPSGSVHFQKYKNLTPQQKMEAIADKFKVTYKTAAVFLKRNNIITNNELSHLFKIRDEENKKRRPKDKSNVRIPRENIVRLDMGKPLFNAVLQAYSSGILDVFDASNILNLRVKKIDTLITRVT